MFDTKKSETMETLPPPYSESSSSQPQTISRSRIPCPLNFYMGFNHFWLGRTQDEKLFAASFGLGCFGRTVMTLYDGPSKNEPVLVTSRYKSGKYIMTIPDRPDSISVKSGKVKGDGEDIVIDSDHWRTCRFSMKVDDGEKGHTEDFEWRNSHGDEIKAVGGRTYGWKLVRLSSRTGGGMGSTSDGLEVVAVVAQNASWSMSKSANIAFLGSGLNGNMGERWELAALLSGLLLWYKNYSAQAAAAGAS